MELRVVINAEHFTMKYVLIITFAIFSTFASAQEFEDVLVSKMQSDGYRLVERKQSLLGRVILEFRSDKHERQIIIKPNTGEIIRDYAEDLDDEDDEPEGWLGRLLNPFYGERDDDRHSD